MKTGDVTNFSNRLSRVHDYVWLFGIMLLALLVRCYHVTSPLDDMMCWRQTQTAGLIRDYYRDGINLLYPRMITLGNPGYVALEFPAYQALAALLYRVFALDVIYARLLTIVCGLLSIVFVYRLALKFLDRKSSIYAAFFFAFMPLNIFFQRVPMLDPLAILLSLVMLDFLHEGIKGKNIFFVLGILAASLGIIIKSPVVAPLYLPLLYGAYREKESRGSSLVRFVIALVIPLIVMLVWQRHANFVNELYFHRDAYPFSHLYSSVIVKLHPFNYWYFGHLQQRLDIQNYIVVMKYIFELLLSIIGTLFFAIGFFILAKRKTGGFLFTWLLSVCVTVMIFFNLFIVHNYYSLPWAPILAMFCGVGMNSFVDMFRKRKYFSPWVTALPLVCFLVASLYLSKILLFYKINDLVEVGEFIDHHIEKNAMIATSLPYDDRWEPSLMYYADRHGFNVGHKEIRKEMIAYLRQEKIKYVALVDSHAAVFPALTGYRVVAENQRVKIYDISLGEAVTDEGEQKPEGVHALFAKAMNAGDLESLCSLFETEAKIVPQAEQIPFAGSQKIRKFLERVLSLKPHINLETKGVTQAGDIALLRSKWHLRGVNSNGKPVEMSGNGTEVVRRQQDGSWRFIVYHPWGAD